MNQVAVFQKEHFHMAKPYCFMTTDFESFN